MSALSTAGVQHPAAVDLFAIGPMAAIVSGIVALLVVPMISSRRTIFLSSAVTLLGLLAAFALTFAARRGSAFQSMLIVDSAAILWQRLLLVFVAGVVVMGFSNTRHTTRAADTPEFFVLLLSATCGMMLMATTSHLLVMLLAMEIASMPSYILAGFNKGRRRSAEASLKFALFGAVCTAIMIYGITLVFGVYRTFDVSDVAQLQSMPPLAAVGWLLVLVGLLFKIGGVPLHFWLPDVFDGAETGVAAFLSVASKGAGVVLLARLIALLDGQSVSVAHGISIVMATVAIATTTIGNLAAWRQADAKRLLAFSSIAHAGYLLCALAIPGPAAIAAAAVYLTVYAVMNLGAFAILAEVESDSGSTSISAFDGLSLRSPLAAVAMAICLFSMVGLPPAAGFTAKWKVLAALGGAGGAWWIVAASVAINSIISLAVYAQILRAMYLRPAAYSKRLPMASGLIGGACAAALVLMLIFFAPLDRWASNIAIEMSHSLFR